jgi:hypothetical protein
MAREDLLIPHESFKSYTRHANIALSTRWRKKAVQLSFDFADWVISYSSDSETESITAETDLSFSYAYVSHALERALIWSELTWWRGNIGALTLT